jgi:hypothetical protein
LLPKVQDFVLDDKYQRACGEALHDVQCFPAQFQMILIWMWMIFLFMVVVSLLRTQPGVLVDCGLSFGSKLLVGHPPLDGAYANHGGSTMLMLVVSQMGNLDFIWPCGISLMSVRVLS